MTAAAVAEVANWWLMGAFAVLTGIAVCSVISALSGDLKCVLPGQFIPAKVSSQTVTGVEWCPAAPFGVKCSPIHFKEP